MDLNAFIAWAAAKPTRTVNIDIKTASSDFFSKSEPVTTAKVWVYDSDLQIGEFVSSVEQINLERKHVEEAHRKLADAQKTIDEAAKQKAEAEAIIAQAEGGQQENGLH